MSSEAHIQVTGPDRIIQYSMNQTAIITSIKVLKNQSRQIIGNDFSIIVSIKSSKKNVKNKYFPTTRIQNSKNILKFFDFSVENVFLNQRYFKFIIYMTYFLCIIPPILILKFHLNFIPPAILPYVNADKTIMCAKS